MRQLIVVLTHYSQKIIEFSDLNEQQMTLYWRSSALLFF